ncbi:MAG: hypothetical protein KAW01_08370 [Deltaproteobacteria bacterium]|nr:hypothetical protein [Deltaproteobacteria bacterium]
MIDGGAGKVMNGDLLGCACQAVLVSTIGDVGETMSVICSMKNKDSKNLPNIAYKPQRETRLHGNGKTSSIMKTAFLATWTIFDGKPPEI